MAMDDERLRSAIHDLLMAGAAASEIADLAAADPAQGQRVINQVMADYVAELNRALASSAGRMYGVDASSFMRQYDTLWEAKRSL